MGVYFIADASAAVSSSRPPPDDATRPRARRHIPSSRRSYCGQEDGHNAICVTNEVQELHAEIERLTKRWNDYRIAHDSVAKDNERLEAENERLQALIRTMLTEDPSDLAADGGVTVLDVWRKEAGRALAREQKEQADG
jgi:hypothetical protein